LDRIDGILRIREGGGLSPGFAHLSPFAMEKG
jgi:hypothetical protein